MSIICARQDNFMGSSEAVICIINKQVFILHTTMKDKRGKSVLSAFEVFKRRDGGGVIKKKQAFGKDRNKKLKNLSSVSVPKAISVPSPRQKKQPEALNGDRISVPSPRQRKSTTKHRVSESIIPEFTSLKESSGSPCGNEESDKCFTWLISPIPPPNFFTDFWEKKPVHLKHRGEFYFKDIISCYDFDRMLRCNHLEFNTNIDIVSYRNGQRVTHNPDGRAYAAVVWDYYQNGHSVRLLNPQTYSRPIWKLCALLQEYFGSFVGANMYLTPPGSQGFAPHYDDIEAFVIQIEGKKHWKIYSPRTSGEELPSESSRNFSQDEIGQPILEIDLVPGDLLYFPRGFIHQANTSDSSHSMHITISTYQKNTYGDLLQKILPLAMEKAMSEDITFRASLPKDYINFFGAASEDKATDQEHAFVLKLIQLTKGLAKYLPVHTGADLMAKEFIHASLPPSITANEKDSSIHGNGEVWRNGEVANSVELKPDTKIAFIRKRAVRVLTEEGKLRLYHTFENSRIYKEREPQYVEINRELLPGIEKLLQSHPDFVAVEELPLQNLEEQMDLASLLYDKGLVRTEVPLLEELGNCDS